MLGLIRTSGTLSVPHVRPCTVHIASPDIMHSHVVYINVVIIKVEVILNVCIADSLAQSGSCNGDSAMV